MNQQPQISNLYPNNAKEIYMCNKAGQFYKALSEQREESPGDYLGIVTKGLKADHDDKAHT